MRTLLLLRHAKSRWDREGVADHDRPLKGRGKRDASRVGWLLVEQDLVPQLLVTSTAKRARGTAKRVARGCNYKNEIVLDHALYQAGPMGYIRMLQKIDDRYHRVMVVGHNPGLELLLEVLTGASHWFRPATLARIDLPIDTWAAIQEYVGGALVDLWGPKLLKRVTKPASVLAEEEDAFEDEGDAFEDEGDAFEDEGDAFEDEGDAFEDEGDGFEDEGHPFADAAFADEGVAFADERCEGGASDGEGAHAGAATAGLRAFGTDQPLDRPSSSAS